MYNYIRGILSEIEPDLITVEAGGVGYGIQIPQSLLTELPAVGTEVKIFTHFSVREDDQSLFGFLYKEDREMFRQLLSVSGIGPKAALAILGIMGPDDLRLAIATGDVKSISRAPGVGKKTAERVILELKDKVSTLSSGEGMDIKTGSGATQTRAAGPVAEAIDALAALGFTRMEAGRAVGMVSLTDDMTTEDVIKAALKQIRQ